MSLHRDWIPSPNYSSRGGSAVRLIVLHTAQGARTFRDLGAYFANSGAGVSSHVGIDDTPGVIGEYVDPSDKAWTQANANPYSVAAELCAFAEWDRGEWERHPAMLHNAGEWIAEESARFGIPLVVLGAGAAQDGHSRGVCQHVDLGALGGGHWDCGPGFPLDLVMQYAGGTAPMPGGKRKGRQMIAPTVTGDGYWCVKPDGAVFAFGDAQYHGGANAPDVIPPGHEIIGIAGKDRDGYWLYGSDGSIYAYGSAEFAGRVT